MVNDSQAYRKMDVTRERISRILELTDTHLSFLTSYSLVKINVLFPKPVHSRLICMLVPISCGDQGF